MAYTQSEVDAALDRLLADDPNAKYHNVVVAASVRGITPDQVRQSFVNRAKANPMLGDYTQDQVNDVYAQRRAEGYNDEQLNELANAFGLTEQNIFDARQDWMETPAGQEWRGSLEDPMQQDWADTFYVGDMEGAQEAIDKRGWTPGSFNLVEEFYGISPEETQAVGERYGVFPERPAESDKPTGTHRPMPIGTAPSGSGASAMPKIGAPTAGGEVLGGKPFEASFAYGKPTAETGGFRNRFTVGAAGNETLGAGNAAYTSDLIKSLRNASSDTPVSTNTGVSMIPGMTSRTPVLFNPGSGNAFNPQPFKQENAPAATPNQQLNTNISRMVAPGGGWSLDQATSALANELSMRPDSSYDALRIQALRYPGMTPELFELAYGNVKGPTPGANGGASNGSNAYIDSPGA